VFAVFAPHFPHQPGDVFFRQAQRRRAVLIPLHELHPALFLRVLSHSFLKDFGRLPILRTSQILDLLHQFIGQKFLCVRHDSLDSFSHLGLGVRNRDRMGIDGVANAGSRGDDWIVDAAPH
jgi:hypothetical protein